ncbi:DUF2309 domain-containing protein [Runella sp.]|jgi:uncharacterized protein|uniref:YbcC family protein n=1 Tax=Runella sp. TaxID=1960881 RepID=UPI00261A26A1|nr:DUF2309 domain-containing protein [Runella sp.]
MKTHNSLFDEHEILHELKHFLPAQAPLKDFIHHNTLHAFQNLKFYSGIRKASDMFGYKTSLSLDEYRGLYEEQRISPAILKKIITGKKGVALVKEWTEKAISKEFENSSLPKIGAIRSNWKRQYQIDMDSLVHPILFRIICSYLDQGISIWGFPVRQKSFLASLREMERNSFSSFFKTERAKQLLLHDKCDISTLLTILVGDESLFKQYLFDQQFAHQGWSGMVSAIEDQPQTLLDQRRITLHDLIVFELLLEIDALEFRFGKDWTPIKSRLTVQPVNLFAETPQTELNEVLEIWQNAFEWTYYDEVLAGIKMEKNGQKKIANKSFQAMFCIDDRECSLRRYLEQYDADCETFGTPGFFGVEFFYQPEDGKFYTKVCPAPVTPKYLIKEVHAFKKKDRDVHFTKHSHSFYGGWLISQTLGFWSAVRLFVNIFRPSMSPATASSFRHMEKYSKLTIENKNIENKENGLQVGFAIDEMAQRVEGLLKSIGLVKDFAPIVYVVGHGSSSVNNPHYAAYDCGACSGRAGSVNSRVICYMANHPKVREILATRGIVIPAKTQFLGALHDTTRDEIAFFDEDSLSHDNLEIHNKNEVTFDNALDSNAKERSRRFESIDSKLSPEKIHDKIRTRSVSLFEPRPELNHATNALCIVGSRELTKGLFLDRRAFMNSYDYTIDPDGKFLFNILKAAAPVCGGINLEYYFSRVDNQKLGAGTKLPHNVMGLFGVANGIDGDLRPGLPSQMIEVHDPVRLLIIVEHLPEVVLDTIQRNAETYEWFINEWVNLVVVHPETKEFYSFKEGGFVKYQPLKQQVDTVSDMIPLLESNQDNVPVYLIA